MQVLGKIQRAVSRKSSLKSKWVGNMGEVDGFSAIR